MIEWEKNGLIVIDVIVVRFENQFFAGNSFDKYEKLLGLVTE